MNPPLSNLISLPNFVGQGKFHYHLKDPTGSHNWIVNKICFIIMLALRGEIIYFLIFGALAISPKYVQESQHSISAISPKYVQESISASHQVARDDRWYFERQMLVLQSWWDKENGEAKQIFHVMEGQRIVIKYICCEIL